MRYVLELAPPLVEPVTLAEARLWARVDSDDTTQDAMLLLLIKSAREKAEDITGRCFARRSFQLVMDEFPADDEPIEIPYPPLITVDSITYTDNDGTDQVLSGSPDAFLVDTGSYPGRLTPLYNGTWPVTRAVVGAVRIAFTAGYAAPKNMPIRVREYVMAVVSTKYENRELLIPSNMTEIPREFAVGLLDNLRVKTEFA